MSAESRLSRWSQRKLAARHGGALPEPADVAAETIRPNEAALPADGERLETPAVARPRNPPPADAEPAQTEAMLTEADLPSIEGLTAQSDYTVFLKNNVPEALRKAALRKLWVSDPVLANLDGLNDYDDDYTIVTAMTMDDTSYKIGRGFLEDEPEPELEPGAEPDAAPQLAQAGDAPAESEIESGESQDDSEAPAGDENREDDTAENGDNDAPSVASSAALRPSGADGPDGEPEPDAAIVKYRAATET